MEEMVIAAMITGGIEKDDEDADADETDAPFNINAAFRRRGRRRQKRKEKKTEKKKKRVDERSISSHTQEEQASLKLFVPAFFFTNYSCAFCSLHVLIHTGATFARQEEEGEEEEESSRGYRAHMSQPVGRREREREAC